MIWIDRKVCDEGQTNRKSANEFKDKDKSLEYFNSASEIKIHRHFLRLLAYFYD